MMPVGLIIAPVAYKDFMNGAFIFICISLWYSLLVDILIYSKDRHEYTAHLEQRCQP